MSVKEDWPRPHTTGRRERELRKALTYGEITRKMYDLAIRELWAAGQITRNGRQIGGERDV